MAACTKDILADFLIADFADLDFNVVNTSEPFIVQFKTFIFERLPYYFKSEDTYKDINNEGLLERYLSIFGSHLDEDLIPDITCYLNILDASICEEKFLTHISDSLGNPPDVFQTEAEYRNLLLYIVSMYKIKGTRDSYELFFSILGFDVLITEIAPIITDGITSRYDSDTITRYDSGSTLDTYDLGECEPCSGYDVELTPKQGSNITLDQSMINKINEVIKFNEPINAKLRNLVIN
jgi:phage tail-like protein